VLLAHVSSIADSIVVRIADSIALRSLGREHNGIEVEVQTIGRAGNVNLIVSLGKGGMIPCCLFS
jgi:hypothetical protein